MGLTISANMAAKELNVQPAVVQHLLETGEIPAYKIGRNWKIPVTLLQKYVEDRAIREAEKRKESTE